MSSRGPHADSCGSADRLTSTNVAVIGGLRTFTLSSQIEFNYSECLGDADRRQPHGAERLCGSSTIGLCCRRSSPSSAAPTSAAAAGCRGPAMLGFEFRPKPWAGLVEGYKAVGDRVLATKKTSKPSSQGRSDLLRAVLWPELPLGRPVARAGTMTGSAGHEVGRASSTTSIAGVFPSFVRIRASRCCWSRC